MPKKFGDCTITAAVAASSFDASDFEVGGTGLGVVAELLDGQTLILGVRLEHLPVLGVHRARHQQSCCGRLMRAAIMRRFRDGRRAVVHGSVGHVHAGELADHRLEFEDGRQRALRDLGLVRRVGGEELPARDDRVDQHGTVVAVNARAEKRRVVRGVLRAASPEILHNLVFGLALGNRQRTFQPDVFR